jgi:hypothetical protein
MKKYYQSDKLQSLIDWDNILEMGRCAGGHDDQMVGLFKDAELIAHWNEGSWDGMVATCVKLPTGEYVIYNDYYGSCSGCDSWEDASDDKVRNLCIDLANGAYIFKSLEDVKEFLSNTSDENRDGNYDWFDSYSTCAKNLLADINR